MKEPVFQPLKLPCGGTYSPGAKSASDSAGVGPYFLDFAKRARKRTTKPLMVTGGFKTRDQAVTALASGNTDVIGLARALVLDPAMPGRWSAGDSVNPEFPRFASPPEGGITAWYTMRLALLGEDREAESSLDLDAAVKEYEERDEDRIALWQRRFNKR